MRAFVRSALYQGHSVLGLRDGIDGLLQDKVYCICFSVEIEIKFELGCLPFTLKTRKFQLENQMVRITPFEVLLNLWASGQSDAFSLSTPFGIYR